MVNPLCAEREYLLAVRAQVGTFYLKWKLAKWSLPSLSLTIIIRQVPFQLFRFSPGIHVFLAHLILVKCLFYLATRDLEQKSVIAREKCFYGCGV